MIAPNDDAFDFQIPSHMTQIIARFAEERDLTIEQALMRLLGTICGIIDMMEEEEGTRPAVIKPDGSVSEILF